MYMHHEAGDISCLSKMGRLRLGPKWKADSKIGGGSGERARASTGPHHGGRAGVGKSEGTDGESENTGMGNREMEREVGWDVLG